MLDSPDRRQFLGAGALALGSLLSGCATTGGHRAMRSACLDPVGVSASRVVRTTVGLRPWRAAGYVVREDLVGDTRVVHNYGHGGSEVTLSWGSGREAIELGLRGHSGPVAVIGAGIIGLTTARLAQEAGFAVTLYAEAMPEATTSAVSGGQFYPSLIDDGESMPAGYEPRLAAALRYSHRRYTAMLGPHYGVRLVANYAVGDEPSQPGRLRALMDPILGAGELLGPGEHPFPRPHARRFETPIVETPRFMARLLDDVRRDGARVVMRRFAEPAELDALPEGLVFNCTGLGARVLFGDAELRPRRGQLVWLPPQAEVDYAVIGNDGLYMFPRADGVLLGGTWDLDDWNLDEDPETTRSLLDGHTAFFEGMRCA